MTWLLVTRSPMAQLALLGLIPGIHIAQISFQVIGNCGVISLMQRSKDMETGQPVLAGEPSPQLLVGEAHNMTVSWHLWLARISSAAQG
jgi:hypothetical protein